MTQNNLLALAKALREALAVPESLVAVSKEEQEARRDIIDLIPELNAALIGDAEVLRELAWSVRMFILLTESFPFVNIRIVQSFRTIGILASSIPGGAVVR